MKKAVRAVLNAVPRRHIHRIAHLAVPLLGLAYLGNSHRCPICGRGLRRFMPYGYVKVRENALCPSCLSLERHRLLWLWLREKTDFFSAGFRMLHIAPERCFMKKFSRLLGQDYITADLESPLAQVKADIHSLPFDNDEFGVVFCNHILEHVEDDRKALREIYRVLSPGGWAIVMSPVNNTLAKTYEDASITSPEGRAAAFGQPDHVREYGKDYPEIIGEAGFDVEERSWDFLSEELKSLYGLKDEIIYIAHKAHKAHKVPV